MARIISKYTFRMCKIFVPAEFNINVVENDNSGNHINLRNENRI